MTISDEQIEAALLASRDKRLNTLTNDEAMRVILEAALSVPQGAPEWQTMDSAPKDGSPFLAYWPGGGEWRVPAVGVRWTWWWAAGTLGMFAGHNAPGPQPTLWCALPAAPSPEGL